MLTMVVSTEEILETEKQTNSLKASGLDSIQAIFYLKSLNIIGNSICNIVRSFIKLGHIKRAKYDIHCSYSREYNLLVLIIKIY